MLASSVKGVIRKYLSPLARWRESSIGKSAYFTDKSLQKPCTKLSMLTHMPVTLHTGGRDRRIMGLADPRLAPDLVRDPVLQE